MKTVYVVTQVDTRYDPAEVTVQVFALERTAWKYAAKRAIDIMKQWCPDAPDIAIMEKCYSVGLWRDVLTAYTRKLHQIHVETHRVR